MVYRLGLRHLGGVSVLALLAAGLFAPPQASACTATARNADGDIVTTPAGGVARVAVDCFDPDGPPDSPFQTSFGDGEGQIYSGNGNDVVIVHPGGFVSAGDSSTQVLGFTPTSFLDSSSTSIVTLGGDDLVQVWGQVGTPPSEGPGTPTDIDLGDGNDTFRVGGPEEVEGTISFPGGNVFGTVLGGDGNDTIEVNALGSVDLGIVAGNGIDAVSILGGVVGTAAAPTEIDLGAGNDSFTVGRFTGATVPCCEEPPTPIVQDGILYGAVLGGDGNDRFTINVGGLVAGGNASFFAIEGGGGIDTVNLLGGAIGVAGSPDVVNLGAGDDIFEARGVVLAGEEPEAFRGILHGSIQGGAGNDTIVIEAGGVVEGSVDGNDGNDTLRLQIKGPAGLPAPVIGVAGASTSVDLGEGVDIVDMSGGTIFGSLFGQGGIDTFNISGGRVEESIFAGSGNDRVNISGTANVVGSISGGAAIDSFNIAGGTISGFLAGDEGNDIVDISGGTVGLVDGGEGNDILTFRQTGTVASVLGGGGDDTVRLVEAALIGGGISLDAGADTFRMSGGRVTEDVDGADGDDDLEVSGGTIGGNVGGGTGNDTVGITQTALIGGGVSLGAGTDTFRMSGGRVTEDVDGADGDDDLGVSGGTIGGNLGGGTGNDTVSITQTALISGGVSLDAGTDTFRMSGGRVTEDVDGGDGDDDLAVSGGVIGGNATGGSGDDTVSITQAVLISGGVSLDAGRDTFRMSGGRVTGDVTGADGDDDLAVSGGVIGGNASGGSGNDTVSITQTALISGGVSLDAGRDTFRMSGGRVTGDVTGGDGDDDLAVSGGTIGGNLSGGDGADSVTVSGGTIEGDVEGETVTLRGGTIGGDISGISGNTLIINGSPTTLDLRNGVVISGTNAVGLITNANLALGGAETQVFTGFNSLGLDASSIGFGNSNIGIAQLNLANGSTLFVRGNANMAGSLNLTGSAIDMIDGVDDDILTLGGIAISNGSIGIDLNQQTLHADQLVAGAFSATGANTIAVNLLGAPEFAGATDIPVIFTNVPIAPGTFQVVGVPGTPASLFTYEVVAGANGGLFIRASPGNFGVALATENAIDVGTVDTAVDAVYGINNDAIAADLGLAGGTAMAPISETFGVFASGQLAHVDHDGFTVTNNNLVGTGPSFDADDFSAAISLDFNAGKQLGLDTKYGLNLGLFAGYASTDVGLGTFQGFSRVGDADNKSGMFGGYGLFRQGQNYLLVSTSVFLGETDVTNGVLNTTGNYGTEGYVVTGSAGHIFNITDRARFDLRGGLMGVSFTGGDFVDSGGNQFGQSEISFGAIKLEPGVYADYQLDNGMVISPYARADLQQRFGYSNTAIIDGREIDFDDADFSAALSTGFNLRMTKTATLSGEVRGKFSSDSSTFGGKLGFKIAF